MRIIVFGIGKYYDAYCNELAHIIGDDKLVAFIDNSITSPTTYEKIPAYNPRDVVKICFDAIIIMSTYINEMRGQLHDLGVDENKILIYEQYRAKKTHGELKIYLSKRVSHGRKVLFITKGVNYSGGNIVAFYAAKLLSDKGYSVYLAASEIEKKLLMK